MAVGRNFDGSIEYVVESSYGAGAGTNPTMKAVSDFIKNVTIGVADEHDILRTISSQNVVDYFKKPRDYTLHIEYIVQNKDFLEDILTRSSGEINSLFFDIGVNKSQTTPSYFRCAGCKAKKVKIEGKNGETWTVTADFSVKEITTSTSPINVGTGSHASPIGTSALTFNVAGSISYGGSEVAYITDSISIDIDNGLQDLWDVGSLTKKSCVAGALSITGTCDITLDDGGKTLFDNIINGTTNSLIVNMGATGSPKLTLSGVRFKSLEIPQDIGKGVIIQGVPFNAKTISISTV